MMIPGGSDRLLLSDLNKEQLATLQKAGVDRLRPEWPRDKVLFEAGPWQQEADRAEWVDPETGYACLITRGPWCNLCGYVAVPNGHPAYGKHYDDLREIDGHNGLTYSGECRGHVCHTPAPGMPDDVWWLGFDTAQTWDYKPLRLDQARAREAHELVNKDTVYRDMAYCRRICADIAMQLWGMTSG